MSVNWNKLFLFKKKRFCVKKIKTEELEFSNLAPKFKLHDKHYQ